MNALYDTIEKLGLSLDSANSARGTLMDLRCRYRRMRIALNFDSGEGQTQLKVYPEDGETGIADACSSVIIDELTGSMKRVYPIERGGELT